MEHVRILIVEDKSVVAEDLRLCLEDFGYQVVGVCNNGADALASVESLSPDILLMDINIKGPVDGVETVGQINETHPLPVIYLTAYSDQKTIERAKDTYPSAYLIKPFDPIDLKIAIDLAIGNFHRRSSRQPATTNDLPVVRDSFFIRQGDGFRKVPFDCIRYLEADGSYVKLYTTSHGAITLSFNMKSVLAHLPPNFLKIHRSFVVNLQAVTGFDKSNVYIGDSHIPVSGQHRELLEQVFIKL